jgi:hypothetical protein
LVPSRTWVGKLQNKKHENWRNNQIDGTGHLNWSTLISKNWLTIRKILFSNVQRPVEGKKCRHTHQQLMHGRVAAKLGLLTITGRLNILYIDISMWILCGSFIHVECYESTCSIVSILH